MPHYEAFHPGPINFCKSTRLVISRIQKVSARKMNLKRLSVENSEYDQEIPDHKPQTTPWHREEELLNYHETPGGQSKQGNQLSLPHQGDCNTRMDTK